MAEWSNATDSSSVPFGGAGSNPAGHISRKVYSKHNLLFAPLVAGSNPAERISSRSSVVERRIRAFRSRWRHKPITHNTIPMKLVASLAQSVEHKTFNLRAAGSSPAGGFI